MSTFLHPARALRCFLRLPLRLPDCFERSRVWSPRSVLLWLLVLTAPDRRTAYRRTLTAMESLGARLLGWTRRPSAASICVARRKLPVAMCRDALHAMVRECERVLGPQRHQYGDRRFIAIDGTRLVTRRSATRHDAWRVIRGQTDSVSTIRRDWRSAPSMSFGACHWTGSWSAKGRASARH